MKVNLTETAWFPMKGEWREREPEFYYYGVHLDEETWLRTPEWKLIRALEPDFHFKPEVELTT